jgi:hypothetical protein
MSVQEPRAHFRCTDQACPNSYVTPSTGYPLTDANQCPEKCACGAPFGTTWSGGAVAFGLDYRYIPGPLCGRFDLPLFIP